MQRSQVELNAQENENKLLKYYSDEADYENQKQQHDSRFINLSLVEIARNISNTIITVINELLDSKTEKTPENLIKIFFSGDRMIYLGLTILIVAVGLYFVDLSGN